MAQFCLLGKTTEVHAFKGAKKFSKNIAMSIFFSMENHHKDALSTIENYSYVFKSVQNKNKAFFELLEVKSLKPRCQTCVAEALESGACRSLEQRLGKSDGSNAICTASMAAKCMWLATT